MQLMEQYTERLNLYISPETFMVIEQVAATEGRKTGNYARLILDRWAKRKRDQTNYEGKKNKKTA